MLNIESKLDENMEIKNKSGAGGKLQSTPIISLPNYSISYFVYFFNIILLEYIHI
jgi:hypothetical protein